MAKRLIPLLDRVLVEKLKPMNKSIGGVLLPDTATHRVGILDVDSNVYSMKTGQCARGKSPCLRTTLPDHSVRHDVGHFM